ncbi:hypothetical protein RhiirA5_396918 [Rhizophagus irregularis]|uniref:RNase H type-1 domain-containing protein n=1 Tax=Rhizophagus irregularis TaxID=588596 RepID=A0A2N0Q037_9GLOM|nr:hypothetical protein RhiirA5_396918 [Rhizophagus irregularis]
MSDETIKKKSNNIVHILMGDFNLISNGHIDRTPPQHISKPKIFNDLEAMGLIDSYRKLNKEVPGNTYHREGVSTRIDQIWISENISNNLMNFSITPSTFITHSDHDIITLTMDTSILIRNNRKNTVYDKLPIGNAYTRVLYDCDDIKTEKWDKFRLNIKSQLNSLDQEIIEDKVNIKEYSQEDIDRYWDKLNSVIVSAADSELPRKVIRLHNTFICYNKKKTRPERHTNKLLKLLHNYYYGNQQMTTSVGAKSKWARKIAKYNQDYVTSTDDYNKCNIVIQDMFSENWVDNLKKKVNYRLRADYKKFKATETKSIKDKIEKRVEITQKDQTTWLSSILDRNTHANIVIDKVLVNEESEGSTKRLATEPGEVKEAVDNDFASMFRKRNTLENSLTPLWQQIYEPAGKFKEVMEATIEKVTMEEWNNTVKDLNKNSTAGLSGINYKIILQLPEEIVILLVKFGNLTETHLMTWKQYRSLALLPVQGRTARWYRDVAHLCTSRTDNLTGILVSYRPGYNDNGTIGWQDNGRVIPAHCCKRAILDRVSNSRGWSFPSEWLSSTHHLDTLIPRDKAPTSAPSLVISLPLVQDIWIHRWIDDDDLKSKLMDIRNILEERISVEYYTDGSLRTSIPTSRDQQDPNLVHTKMGAAFCVNDEPALSAQANLSLWPSSTRAELVAIFLALLTGPMNAKIKIYTDSLYMINNRHNKLGRKLLKQSNSLILLKIDILLQEKKMDLVLVKVKGHSGDVMNEMVDKLAKNTSNDSGYFNNRFNYSNRKVRFFPTFKQIPIEYNLRKFIKTLMNTKVAAEWSMLKSNGHEIPIDWNITWNLIHRYKGFNCISVKKHWHLIFIVKLFAKLLPIGVIHFAHYYPIQINKSNTFLNKICELLDSMSNLF